MRQKTRLLTLLVLLAAVVTGAWAQTGMTNGLFSVSATKKVYFSKGNLQLVGENTFQFAENQWDYFGINQSDYHRDLFCWGTGNNPNQTTGNSTFTDWGDNTYLQATLGKGWRTMTQDEFAYVFNTRASGSSVFGNANGRYTTATINTDGTGVNGFILFPDGITIEASEVTTAGTINNKGTVTQCTTAQWAALAKKGCVFLPAGGYFLPAGGAGYGSITDYWSSTAVSASKAYNLNFNFGYPQGGVNPASSLGYNYGCLVRLVIDGYVLTLADGTQDADKWTASTDGTNFGALPIGGLKGDGSETVTLQYNGRLKVKGVKATSDAAPAAKPDLLSGVFSVSASKKVKFSKGNLRYASGTWSFFDNQYDYYTSYSADAWDHFGWSTSATTYGMNTSTDNATYSGDFVDWGSNSDLQTALGTGWFTLSKAESTYLFNTRSASTVGGTSNGRYAKAKVNGVWGVILFPDTYTHPDGVTAPVGVNAGDDTGWNGNNYSSADWTKMESAGCVFLPAAGYRDGESLVSTGIFGAYWSATSSGKASDYSAYDFVYYYSGYLDPAFTNTRNLGFCVRLVQEVAPTY